TVDTMPIRSLTRDLAKDLMCWHCAAETTASRLAASGSMTTSALYRRTVDVSGTTCTMGDPASSASLAVTTTAGREKPASRPCGRPKSIRTMSPEVGIEPGDLVVPESFRGQLGTELALCKRPHRQRHG